MTQQVRPALFEPEATLVPLRGRVGDQGKEREIHQGPEPQRSIQRPDISVQSTTVIINNLDLAKQDGSI